VANSESSAEVAEAAFNRFGVNLWVVVPAYNEDRVLGEVLASLVKLPCHVVVVDDGSTDATARVAAEAGVTVIRHVVNLGQGAALQTGIDYALQEGASYICTFDADGQHSPQCIPKLLDRLLDSKCDIVMGSRFLGQALGMPKSKELILKAALAFTRIHSGLTVTDTHNGLRMMTRSTAQKIRILQTRMAHASEILIQIREGRLKYEEVPVTITYNEYSVRKGQSIRGALRILGDLFYARWSK
jgi:polyprenyl-phospho-N-acetylgalactosaminyl synthase